MRFLLLGLPPSTNNLYAVVAGHQVLVEPGRAFHAAMRQVAARQWTTGPSRQPFAVQVTYHLGGYDRDVDGSHKPILDALSGLVWVDDRQVVLFVALKRRLSSRVLPYLSVIVRELPQVPPFAPGRPPRRAEAFLTEILPPSTNNSYTVFGGRRHKTAAAKQVTAIYRAGFQRLAGRRPPLKDSLCVRLRHGYRADRRDVDGSHKLLFDAARGVLWVDDRQILRFSVAKGRVPAGQVPRISGALWSLTTPLPLAERRRAA